MESLLSFFGVLKYRLIRGIKIIFSHIMNIGEMIEFYPRYYGWPNKILKNMQQINRYNQSQLIIDNDLASLHLSNAISPNPLAFRDDKKHIESNILTNTNLICQEKHANKQEGQVMNKPLNMDVDGWLKAVQNSVVESSLVDVAA